MMIRQSYHLYRWVSLLLLLVFCSIAVQAQNIAVKSFAIDETDMTANTTGTTVIDQNGQKCALIKMITTQTGFTFDAGSLGIVKTEQHVGEIWIYLPEGVKRLTISHPQLGQLRDYDLGQTLKRARTYILYLKAGEVANVPQTQKLTIDYTPVNAMVLIDSKPFTGNGHLETVLPIGNHNYIIAAEGYESAEGSFKLTTSAPRTITEHLVVTESDAITATVTKQNETHEKIQDSRISNDPFEAFFSNPFGKKNKEEMTNDFEMLGVVLRPITDSQKKELGIKYGLQVTKLNKGVIKESGIPIGFVIMKADDDRITSLKDFQQAVKKAKDEVLYINGIFPTGKRGYFVVALK